MASLVPPICRPSPISEDWVRKGFHVHVENVELVVRPGHRPGMVVCKRFFRADSPADIDAAARLLKQHCLSSKIVRGKWIETLSRAMGFLDGYRGDLPERANGRKYEFRRLQKALLDYKED